MVLCQSDYRTVVSILALSQMQWIDETHPTVSAILRSIRGDFCCEPTVPLALSRRSRRAGSGRVRLFDRPDRSWFRWVIGTVFVVLMVWFDYYHPPGILFDIILVIALVVIWGRQNR
jgi:hypothetical protein